MKDPQKDPDRGVRCQKPDASQKGWAKRKTCTAQGKIDVHDPQHKRKEDVARNESQVSLVCLSGSPSSLGLGASLYRLKSGESPGRTSGAPGLSYPGTLLCNWGFRGTPVNGNAFNAPHGHPFYRGNGTGDVYIIGKQHVHIHTLSIRKDILRLALSHYPEGPSTQYLRTLVPNTIQGMAFGTRILKYWVLGPSGLCGSHLPMTPPGHPASS